MPNGQPPSKKIALGERPPQCRSLIPKNEVENSNDSSKLEKQMQDALKTVSSLNDQMCSGLRTQLAASNQDLKTAKARIEQLEDEARRSKEELDLEKKGRRDAEEKHRQEEFQKTQMKAHLDLCQEALRTSDTTVKTVNEKRAKAEADASALRTNLEKLTKEKNAMKGEISVLQADNSKLKADEVKVANIDKHVRSLMSFNEQLESENKNLLAKNADVNKLEKEMAVKTKKIEELEEEMDVKTKRIEELEFGKEKKQMQADKEALEVQLLSARTEIASLKGKKELLENNVATLRSELKAKDLVIDQLNTKVDKLVDQLHDAHREMTKAKTTISILTDGKKQAENALENALKKAKSQKPT